MVWLWYPSLFGWIDEVDHTKKIIYEIHEDHDFKIFHYSHMQCSSYCYEPRPCPNIICEHGEKERKNDETFCTYIKFIEETNKSCHVGLK